jgi:MOSC domain-containing protein YiiM
MGFGRVVAVSISAEKGTRKTNVPQAWLTFNWGLENDAHGGGWHRQVSLLALESIERMRQQSFDVNPGDFAENITTEGITLNELPLGTLLRVGSEVRLQVTQIGKQCHTGCAVFQQVGQCIMPKEGIFARVLQGGTVCVGDPIKIVEKAPH